MSEPTQASTLWCASEYTQGTTYRLISTLDAALTIMKIAICNETFQDWPLDRAMAYARECGYQGIEFAPFTLGRDANDISVATRQEVRQLLDKHGLESIGLHWLLAKTEGYYLTSPDPDVRARTTEYFVQLAQLCHDLGGSVMVLGSPQQRNLLEGVSHEQAMENAAEVIRGTVDDLERLGVTIALEPLAPAEGDFLLTAESGVQLAQMIDSPYVRLHLDVKAMSSESKPIPDIIRDSADYLEHFHTNDANTQRTRHGRCRFHSHPQGIAGDRDTKVGYPSRCLTTSPVPSDWRRRASIICARAWIKSPTTSSWLLVLGFWSPTTKNYEPKTKNFSCIRFQFSQVLRGPYESIPMLVNVLGWPTNVRDHLSDLFRGHHFDGIPGTDKKLIGIGLLLWDMNADFTANTAFQIDLAPRLVAFDARSAGQRVEDDAVDRTHFQARFATRTVIGVDDGEFFRQLFSGTLLGHATFPSTFHWCF